MEKVYIYQKPDLALLDVNTLGQRFRRVLCASEGGFGSSLENWKEEEI